LKIFIKKYAFLLKTLTVVFILLYLVFKLWNSTIYTDFKNISIAHYKYLTLACILVFINWGLEAKKWQIQIKNIQSISFFTAYKAILSGLSSGLLTPNRLGNFIGRLSFIDKKNRHEATLQTLLGNLAQFISTIIFGLIGLAFYSLIQLKFQYSEYLVILTSILAILSLTFYFYPNLANGLFFSRLFSQKTKHTIETISKEKVSKKIIILNLSAVRYLIFCSQYTLLFLALNIDLDLILLLSLTSITYLITTIIPSPIFGKLFIRESAAVFVFSLANINLSTILVVTFMLWVINIALPATLGSIIWLKQKHV